MKASFSSIIQDSRPVVIDFHATWCAPCRAQAPILQQVASEMGDRVKVVKIDIDENPELADRYQIQSVPTLMVFKNGEIKYKQSGVHSKPQLISVLEGAM